MDMVVQSFFNPGVDDEFDEVLKELSLFSEYTAAAHNLDFDDDGNLFGTLVVQFGADPLVVTQIDPNNAVELAKGCKEAAQCELDEAESEGENCSKCVCEGDDCDDTEYEDFAKLGEELSDALDKLKKLMPFLEDDKK